MSTRSFNYFFLKFLSFLSFFSFFFFFFFFEYIIILIRTHTKIIILMFLTGFIIYYIIRVQLQNDLIFVIVNNGHQIHTTENLKVVLKVFSMTTDYMRMKAICVTSMIKGIFLICFFIYYNLTQYIFIRSGF